MHELFAITEAHPCGDSKLAVTFSDGVTTVVDLSRILKGRVYGPLADPAVFAAVTVDPEVHTVVWPNGADFDPETLRNWDAYEPDWAKLATTWELAAVG